MTNTTVGIESNNGDGAEITSSILPTMTRFIQSEFGRAQARIREALPDVGALSREDRVLVLKRYAAAIGPNFVPWMAAASVCSRSLEARFAAAENIYLEIKDDHRKLLQEFAGSCNADPDRVDIIAVSRAVDRVRDEVSEMSGIFVTTLMGFLESASAYFIPWLAEIASSLGGTDRRYTDIHGAADAEHAEQFIWALANEARHYDDPQLRISQAVDIAFGFTCSALSIAEIQKR